MSYTISAILPCYNEKTRIIPIIDQIKKVPLVNEIIVVDDGSKNATRKILQQIKGIKLITHLKNKGKTQAIKTGVDNSTSDILIFIDSDLKNFKNKHLISLLTPILNNSCDLVLSQKEKESLHCRLSGFSVAYTGERVIKKKLILKYPEIFDNPGYLLEASINKIFFKKYRVGKIFLKNVGQWSKTKKIGVKGILGDVKMLIKIVQFLGIKEFIFQLNFAKIIPNY